jgi:hypothetical protein
MNESLEPVRPPSPLPLDPYARGATATRSRSMTGPGTRASCTAPEHQTPPSGLELVSEVGDLAVGAGMLTLTLAPFALPALALLALTAVVVLIPALGVGLLLAPCLVARRWWRSRHGSPGTARSARSGDGNPGYETMRRQLVVRRGPAHDRS